MIKWLIITAFIIFFLIPFIAGYTGKLNILKFYGVTYSEIEEDEEESEINELEEINRQERITLLDQTLVQYNKLIDNLADQYLNETDEKKKAVILSKQIAALEKYNKALERMEKLEKLE